MVKKKHRIRDTSLEAYYEVLEDLEGRQREVYAALRELGPANNTMIANKLNLPINSITPRIHELRALGLVIFYKKDKCPYTSKKTIFWKVRKDYA
jgi:Mn-dependent DtxR family transcriptional regulator